MRARRGHPCAAAALTRPARRFRSEANRALAKMSLKDEDCVPDTEGALRLRRCRTQRAKGFADVRVRPHGAPGLSLMEQDILKDWKAKFETKYTKVGTVKR